VPQPPTTRLLINTDRQNSAVKHNQPSDIFTKLVFFIKMTTLSSMALLFLKDLVLGTAVVSDEKYNQEKK